VLLYGHLDKQPEMVGWTEGYGPWVPRLEGDKLYGRGGADDGYAMFGALSALMALREQKVAHAHCVVLIEACEESGSYDLPYYVDHLAQRIGSPSLVVCLDSGCGNYDQLWMTTSLRGMASGTLTVEVLDEGVHSGDASGIVPSSFRILRRLLSRLEDEETGPYARSSSTGRAGGAGLARRGGAGRRRSVYQVSTKDRHVTDERRSDRTGAQSHLAPATGDHWHPRAADPDGRWQCAVALDRRQAQPAPAAIPRCGGGRQYCSYIAGERPALWGEGR
jgi:acetylornithine deacetylase/succinyl-diaminopimelate desuccinylase-like protein